MTSTIIIHPTTPRQTGQAKPVPHQSRTARFPGISLAATDLGVSRVHLYRVLTGERKSPPLKARWNAWLKARPSFSNLQH